MNNEMTQHWESQQRYWYQHILDAQRQVEYCQRQHEIACHMLGQLSLREQVELIIGENDGKETTE